jgi:hypothetical protein
MTARQLIVGTILLVGAPFAAAMITSSATQAQGFCHQNWHGSRYRELYNYYAPDPISLSDPVSPPNYERGGPGPRVGDGSGMGIGAQR